MSWLVRCWEEPREDYHESPVYRCSVRDLRTGEERYLNDPREIGELMLRQVQAQRKAASPGPDMKARGAAESSKRNCEVGAGLASRKTYSPPALMVYGSLRELTREANVQQGFDGIFGSVVGD